MPKLESDLSYTRIDEKTGKTVEVFFTNEDAQKQNAMRIFHHQSETLPLIQKSRKREIKLLPSHRPPILKTCQFDGSGHGMEQV